MRHLLLVGALLTPMLAAACGGRYPSPGGGGGGDGAGPRGVEAAALPYEIVDGRTGAAIPEDAFWTGLAASRVVCVGEEHSNPHHHWAQLQIVDRLSARRTSGLALGLEMVQRPFQAVLDDYAAGRIDDAAMRSRVGWEDRWGYDFALYRPILRRAIERGAALIALNAARELTKKAARQGLEALTPAERAQLARELVLDDAEHRAWFDEIMASMGGAEAHAHGRGHAGTNGEPAPERADLPPDHPPVPAAPSADRIYAVQVIWDETMAETAAAWVAAGGDRAMIVLAGNGHCHDSAIVRRVARRGVPAVVSVRPIIDDGEGNVAATILEARHDYLFVMRVPGRGGHDGT